eukprot:4261122-Prymnesium_polylepis.1
MPPRLALRAEPLWASSMGFILAGGVVTIYVEMVGGASLKRTTRARGAGAVKCEVVGGRVAFRVGGRRWWTAGCWLVRGTRWWRRGGGEGSVVAAQGLRARVLAIGLAGNVVYVVGLQRRVEPPPSGRGHAAAARCGPKCGNFHP